MRRGELKSEGMMHRKRLLAFHGVMFVAYLLIIGSCEAGYTRVGFALWVAALVVFLTLLFAYLSYPLSAWFSQSSETGHVPSLRAGVQVRLARDLPYHQARNPASHGLPETETAATRRKTRAAFWARARRCNSIRA